MWGGFGLLLRTIKQPKELLNYCFTHLLYLSGPVNPIASIILVKTPTFSSDGCKESFAERCCKIEIAHISVSAIKIVIKVTHLTENFRAFLLAFFVQQRSPLKIFHWFSYVPFLCLWIQTWHNQCSNNNPLEAHIQSYRNLLSKIWLLFQTPIFILGVFNCAEVFCRQNEQTNHRNRVNKANLSHCLSSSHWYSTVILYYTNQSALF